MTSGLLKQICDSPKLPSMPASAARLLELVERQNVDIAEIADVVARDPAISAKVLRVANSAAYGQARRVSTLNQALMVLDLRTVKTLVIGFSLARGMQSARAKGLDHEGFWRRSLVAAAASKALALRAGVTTYEEAFLGGLLHGIGLLAMASTLDDHYAKLLEAANGSYETLRSFERETFGFDHSEVAGSMAER